MGSDRLSRANITVYDPSVPGTRVLRVTTGNGHMTRPTDTPANTFFLPVLKQPADMSRNMFAPGTTSGRSKVGLGDVIISNADGALDGWQNYAFDGWPITIEDGTVAGGFTPVLVATMDGTPEFGAETITIHLRDRQAELDVPLQTNLYLGTNALPAGLEGVSDIKGKKKPFCLGQVLNVPAVCVNTAKLLYQVHDGAVASMPNIYDRGVVLKQGRGWNSAGQPAGAFNWKSIAYGAGLFVIGNSNGDVYTSPTGAVWTSRLAGVGIVEGIAWNGTMFVLVTSGNIYTSVNGTAWTNRGANAVPFTTRIVWATTQGLWVRVGISGRVITSPDGITWTNQTAPTTDNFLGIAYGNDITVACTNAGSIYSSNDGGVNWILRAQGVGGYFAPSVLDVTFGGGQFLAVGAVLATSVDGLTWTRTAQPDVSGGILMACTYSNGVYFLGNATNTTIYSSTDLVTWLPMTPPAGTFGTSENIIGMATDGVQVVAITQQGGGVTTGHVAYTTGVVYANTTDLQNDALMPHAGEAIACPSAGYFRLGSRPIGTPTADVTEGATAADRTVAQLFKRALLKAGKTAADYVAADLVALDALNSAVCGIWFDDDSTVSSVLDQIAGSIWAWWSPDRAGLYRIKQFAAPSGASTFSFGKNDLRKPLEVTATSDAGKGVPAYRTIVRYAKNYTVQTTDLAASVSAARRVVLAAEWQAAQYLTAGVQTAHLLAPEIVEDSCLVNEADALAEATRRQGIRGTRRDRFPLLVELTDANAQIDFGDVGTLTHKRYGLSAGTLVRVLGAEPNKARNEVLLTVWR